MISTHQAEQIKLATSNRIGILTGGPGTGKTHTVGHFIREYIQQNPKAYVGSCAPTGKAAVRLTESLHAANVQLNATTRHRLLGVKHELGKWAFDYNTDNPLPAGLIVADEQSMESTNGMADLFAAIGPTTRVLLVGDPYQLPPVGHGAPFRDLIASGQVAHGNLEEVWRNDGGVVRICKDIREGNDLEIPTSFNTESGENVRLMHAANPTQSISRINALLRGVPLNVDPVWDCQIITATNKSGALSRCSINEELQGLLNPGGDSCGLFRTQDKVICNANGFYESAAKKGVGIFVANGEIGRVVGMQRKKVIIEMLSPVRRVLVSSRTKEGGNWSLAYAVTCHKMQGSSAKFVIVVADDSGGANQVCSREWWYTALSRTEEKCFVVGRMATVEKQCQRSALDGRKTFLKERIMEIASWVT